MANRLQAKEYRRVRGTANRPEGLLDRTGRASWYHKTSGTLQDSTDIFSSVQAR
jgi:hypothetical protein